MKDRIKILLVDDDEEDYLLTKETVKEIAHKKYELDWISSYSKGLDVIRKNNYDIYLIDYRLGTQTGIELIEEVVKSGGKGPFILLTGEGSTDIDEKAMKAGAAYFISKSNLNPLHLERSIRYSIRHANNLNEIRTLNEELEKRVDERTQMLAGAIYELEYSNANLKKAQKEVQIALEKEKSLSELKSRFVSTASHEFRTPLATILSSVSLLSKYNSFEDADKRIKHINRIKSAVNNLREILNDFLSLSKLEEGKTDIHKHNFSLPDLFKEVTDEMQAILKKDQKILYNHKGKEECFLDKNLLKNVLINLLSNAIKYTPEGKKISIRSECMPTETSIRIEDQGMGIPENDQSHLFKQFFRAQNAIGIQGTGLGLNIVKKYIELMNGSISFTSKFGKGTIFTVKLP